MAAESSMSQNFAVNITYFHSIDSKLLGVYMFVGRGGGGGGRSHRQNLHHAYPLL